MSFRIAARTILHLGAELISSDGIALYELIKNAYDAGSPTVDIHVVVALSRSAQWETLKSIAGSREQGDGAGSQAHRLSSLRKLCLENIEDAAPNAEKVRKALSSARTLEALEDAVLEANRIRIVDQGRGMSLTTLNDAFLTIGTRWKQSSSDADESSASRAILGEKGIGRLSTMRLGRRMRVRTATKMDRCWNELEIDWSLFDHTSDALVEDIPLAPRAMGEKTPPDASGTRIVMRALRRDWSREHVEEIVARDFARLNDPFASTVRFPVIVRYNNDLLPIPQMDRWILKHYHGRCSGEFRALSGDRFVFSGKMETSGKIDNFSYSEVELLSVAKVASLAVLRNLGPFTVKFYWFNRKKLVALEGAGTLEYLKKVLEQWSGGLMLFRDGFRVLPYGSDDDDWLGLDKKAFSAGGYKLNRHQVVGRVVITRRANPHLMDQANREGLIDNEEKRALTQILKALIDGNFRPFLNKVAKAAAPAREPSSEAIIKQRLLLEERRLEDNLTLLIKRVPALSEQTKTLAEMRQGIGNLKAVMNQVQQLAQQYEQGRTELLNLAGVGLTVEILAHELGRATATALDTIAHLPTAELSATIEKSLGGLSAQLKTLQKRLKVLDPLSTSGRNRKEKTDIHRLLSDIMESHVEHFAREGVISTFEVLPDASAQMKVTVVRGMIVQVLENIISNALYWLRQQKLLIPEFRPKITLVLDTDSREVRFTDNGPGVAEHDKEKIFEAFWTKKPADEGKGLGLFISHEIAKYHGAELRLELDREGVLRTFILDLGGVK